MAAQGHRTAIRPLEFGDTLTALASSTPVAVVTGGARGIGLAVAQWFLAHGHRVALLDIDRDTLGRMAAELSDGQRVLAVPCDVSNP